MWEIPKDEAIHTEPVNNVSEFIERVNKYIDTRKGEDFFTVYRGEPELYATPCRPGIFRTDLMRRNKYFEKSLFDAMRQTGLTGKESYLDNAIDAQHGEFPSRLLDVTYNCLIALYFAATPYYHKKPDAMDNKDGMVFLFFIHEIYSPSGENINENYNTIINRSMPWYENKSLFKKNHKFIDHSKLNKRIIAQQGAFILFPGDEPEKLPPWMSYGILIPKGAKAGIRRELKQLFGIHTGSIYPETVNLVEDLSDKSSRLNTKAFNFKHELSTAMSQMDKELDYYLVYAIRHKDKDDVIKDQIMLHIKRVINSYRNGLLELKYEAEKQDQIDLELLSHAIEQYNRLVEDFYTTADQHHLNDAAKQSLII